MLNFIAMWIYLKVMNISQNDERKISWNVTLLNILAHDVKAIILWTLNRQAKIFLRISQTVNKMPAVT